MNESEIIQRFEQNHREFLKKVGEQPAATGAQLLEAGQYAELEAYTEVFGDAFGDLYKTMLRHLDFDLAKQCRANIQQTELNSIVEEFKAEFKAIISFLVDLSLFKAFPIMRRVQDAERRLYRELMGKRERRYKLSFFPVDNDGNFSAPDGVDIFAIPASEVVAGFEDVT